MSPQYHLTWNPPKPTVKSTEYNWTADHAALNHEGGIKTNGQVYMARPWTEYAVKNLIDLNIEINRRFAETGDISKAFVLVSHDLKDAFREAIEAPVYQWDGTTYRRNGEVVTSPRDVVDTGELRDSLEMTIR